MRVLIQRVKQARVLVDTNIVGQIERGLCLFLGITHTDTSAMIPKMVDKILHLRVFEDHHKKMNLSLKEKLGSILLISQFTLYADMRKGRRPSFIQAAYPSEAEKLYHLFALELKKQQINVQEGVFGADMDVELINEGPATFWLDSIEWH